MKQKTFWGVIKVDGEVSHLWSWYETQNTKWSDRHRSMCGLVRLDDDIYRFCEERKCRNCLRAIKE